MKTAKTIFIMTLAIFIIYIGISFVLLNGKLVYTTSFNESTIESSQKRKIFINNNLKVLVQGDSLKNWQSVFDVWTNKQYEIKYFGILFHWTYTKPEWRYLNIKFKDGKIRDNWCVRYSNEKYYSECCNRISCNVGDTITITFYRFKEETELGKLKILIK